MGEWLLIKDDFNKRLKLISPNPSLEKRGNSGIHNVNEFQNTPSFFKEGWGGLSNDGLSIISIMDVFTHP